MKQPTSILRTFFTHHSEEIYLKYVPVDGDTRVQCIGLVQFADKWGKTSSSAMHWPRPILGQMGKDELVCNALASSNSQTNGERRELKV